MLESGRACRSNAKMRRICCGFATSFLNSRMYFGKIVVHGHTPTEEPEVLPNRIKIDTGAFATGRLTCLVIDHDQRRFLSTE